MWHENSLLSDEIDGLREKCAVFLARQDNLIDAGDVYASLRRAGVERLFLLDGLHGQAVLLADERLFETLDELIVG